MDISNNEQIGARASSGSTHEKADALGKDGGYSESEAASKGPHTAVQVGESKQTPLKVPKFPWKNGALDKFKLWLVTPNFQAALQLAVGTFIVSLFVFVMGLNFKRSCLSTILFVAAMLLVANDAHVGSRLAGAALLIGAFWFGGLVAAAAISLARLPGVAYTTFLILFTAIGLVVTTTMRVKGNLGVGIISNLGFGIMLTGGQFLWPAEKLWKEEYTRILRTGLVASLGVTLAGLLVLPSLAGDDVRKRLAHNLKDLGHVLSNAASNLLMRVEDEHKLDGGTKEERNELSRSARELVMQSLEERQDEEQIERDSHPGADLRPQWTKQRRVSSMSEVRASLASCRETFKMSALEPPFLRWRSPPYNTFKWPAVMNALDTLIMRIAALESIIEGEHPMMLDGEIKQTLGLSLLPAFRLLFAQIAASCASAGKAINADVIAHSNDVNLLFEPSWAMIEYELAGALYSGMKSFWASIKAKAAKDFISPSPEVRAMLYMGTIGTAIMEAMAAFEKTLRAALHSGEESDTEKVTSPVLDAIQILREAAESEEAVNVIKAPPLELDPVNVMLDMERDKTASQEEVERGSRPEMQRGYASFKRSFRARPMQKSLKEEEAAGKSGAADPPAAKPAKISEATKDRVMRNFAWAIPLVKAMFAWDVLNIFRDLVVKDIPRACGSPAKLWKTFWTDRWFQFAIKYYAASVLVLGILLALQADYPSTREWNGLYINITVVVVLSEKVDTTFQKGVLRIVTTVVGGVLGYLVMLDYDVATNPYGLMAITVAFAFVSGLMALGTLKYAIFLTLITFDGIVLCQYTGHTKGVTKNFYSRLIVTIWGVLLCLGFDLLFPWYAASSAMQDLGKSFQAVGEIFQHFHQVNTEELHIGHLRGKEKEAALEARKQGILSLEKGVLQKRVAGPLGAVQISLAKEGVLWKRGILAMPRIVGQSIALLQSVLDRLGAVELMLLQKPIVSGRFSGAPWHYLHSPLEPELKSLSDSILALCNATCQAMGEFPKPQDLQDLDDAIHTLHQSRLRWRAAFRVRLQSYLGKINADGPLEPLVAERSIDDGIRYQSTIFALSKATDKAMLLARTVAADPWIQLRARHPHTWQIWRSWIGKYGYD